MKKIFIIALTLLWGTNLDAQITYDGNGNAGLNIGPASLMKLRVGGDNLAVSGTESNYRLGIDLQDFRQNISGTDNGYRTGFRAETYIEDVNFTGSLAAQYSGWFRSGINGASTGSITNSYGLLIESLSSGSAGSSINNLYGLFLKGTTGATTVQNYFAIYQDASIAKNYFAGNTGIGTETIPDGYKLAVNGKGIFEEVMVQLNGQWPDYVFTPNYNLKSLSDTESYIASNGHLPGIPSAKEVQESGITLGEMNANLLEKIEELFLHSIEQEKTIDELKERVAQLEIERK